MWRLFAVLWVVLATHPTSQAQQPVADQAAEKVTYFLIDSSGSMKGDNALEAEREVLKILKPIQEANPTALVSRTYFRADNRDLCTHPVSIAPLLPVTESVRQFPTNGNNDYTPLGTALESAIKLAGNQPIDIFIVSDEVQSPDCGVDVCEVARMYLPLEGVDVRTIAIGEDAKANGRLRCIDAAQVDIDEASQSDSGQEGASVTPSGTGSANTESTSTFLDVVWRNWVAFWEKWFWLLCVAFMTGSAVSIGFRESNRSRILENYTSKARVLHDRMTTADNTAEAELIALRQKRLGDKNLSTIRTATSEDHDDSKPRSWAWLAVFKYWLGLTGLVLLWLLAALPDKIWIFNVKNPRDAAWAVFNSMFATAFAVTWIAIIFFAASQSQRRREAEHNFDIVTTTAKRIADLERSRALKKYNEAKKRIEDLTSKEHLAAFVRFDETTDSVRGDAEYVLMRLRKIALPRQLDEAEDIDSIENEAQRVAELVISSWGKLDLRGLVSRLEQNGLSAEDSLVWKKFRIALSTKRQSSIEFSVKELAQYLRKREPQ